MASTASARMRPEATGLPRSPPHEDRASRTCAAGRSDADQRLLLGRVTERHECRFDLATTLAVEAQGTEGAREGAARDRIALSLHATEQHRQNRGPVLSMDRLGQRLHRGGANLGIGVVQACRDGLREHGILEASERPHGLGAHPSVLDTGGAHESRASIAFLRPGVLGLEDPPVGLDRWVGPPRIGRARAGQGDGEERQGRGSLHAATPRWRRPRESAPARRPVVARKLPACGRPRFRS
jgi:hypothetical protein